MGLASLFDWPFDIKVRLGPSGVYMVAQAILANPQDHIDALVEAGALQQRTLTNGYWFKDVATVYAVVQPHKHEWRVDGSYSSSLMPTLFLRCTGCGDFCEVENRLPIEVPS